MAKAKKKPNILILWGDDVGWWNISYNNRGQMGYRTPIALSAPTLRPVLSGVCQVLGCTVGYARRIERISIVSSSLRPPTGASQAEDDGRSRLVLMLDLTDLSDTVVARKAILPEQYLPPGQADRPLGAGAEVTLTIPIQVNALQVNGYQLDKFFP